jgi:hypothetical protein
MTPRTIVASAVAGYTQPSLHMRTNLSIVADAMIELPPVVKREPKDGLMGVRPRMSIRTGASVVGDEVEVAP